MTRNLALLLLCALPAAACAANAPAAKTVKSAASAPKTEEEKTLFAIGVILSGSVRNFALSPQEMQLVQAGFADGLHGSNPAFDADSYRPKIQAMLSARAAQVTAKAKEDGKAYREQASKAKDATTTASGLVMTTVRAGTGATPAASDQVKVHYEGRLIDGTVFDSSIKRGQPATFPVSAVVPCWTEALQRMSVGAKIKLVCPPELAYGDRGSPPRIPGGSTLVFDVELLDIVKASPPAAGTPAAPASPAAPAVPAAPAASAAPAAPPAPAAGK